MNDSKLTIRGELTLILVVIINSLGVVLMLHSGSGISAISSVPYAFSEVFPKLTLGTWTYIFQSLLILTLMVLRKKFIPEYLFSFVIGFFFGKMVDIHQAQVNGTKLSNSLKLRLERAKEYLDENPETIAVVSGRKGSGEEISEAEAMYEYLVSQGIDETRLIKEDRSTNTNENLKYSLALLEEKSNKKPEDLRIGIVTNGFHVFRGTSIGKKMGCRQIEGVPAKSNKFLQLNYLVRECLGIWKDKLVGNL